MRGAPSRTLTTPLEQINSEIFTLTYGSFVRQLLADYDDLQEVHKQMEKIGHGIGVRLIDDFLSKTQQRCSDFRETANVIASQAFPMFLNIYADIKDMNADGTECCISFRENPLCDFVELPQEYKDLKYSIVLCGVITGALEMVNMSVECDFHKDMLRGDDCYEIKIKLISHEPEHYPFKDDE